MPGDISQWLRLLRDNRPKVQAAILQGVDEFGEHVLGDAQQLTPVATGFLQASGNTQPAKIEGEEIVKEIGFNASYAAAVHERLDVKHTNGQAKFLETAMRQDAPKLQPYVAKRTKEAFEG